MSNSTPLFPPTPARSFDSNPMGDQRETRNTFAAKVAAFLESRPGEWIDGREVLKIAGCYGWRTRISDCRRAPYNLNIVNRQRRLDGYTVSEYMLVTGQQDLDGAA